MAPKPRATGSRTYRQSQSVLLGLQLRTAGTERTIARLVPDVLDRDDERRRAYAGLSPDPRREAGITGHGHRVTEKNRIDKGRVPTEILVDGIRPPPGSSRQRRLGSEKCSPPLSPDMPRQGG
jgi:hypothetical protein